MCLLLGPPGVGKTLFLKRLNVCTSSGNYNCLGETPATIPTVGTNLVNVFMGRKGELTVREVGGGMAPIWHNYYDECNMLMYMIDISNKLQVSAACILLLELLNNSKLQKMNLMILFNKIDSPTAVTRTEFDHIIRLNDICKHCRFNVTVMEVSAKKGNGLKDVVKWMQQNYH